MSASAIARTSLDNIPSLPDGWRWAAVRDLCRSIDYGFTASADFKLKEPRFLRITDIQNGRVEWTEVPGCQIDAKDEAVKRLEDGDIVFARSGATSGKSLLVQNPPRSVFASYLIRLRVGQHISPRYLWLFFQSAAYWQQIRDCSRGGAQPNVNATLLGKIRVPLAPYSEQRRMVDALDDQMTAVERAQATVKAQLRAAKALPSAYLRSVFDSPEAHRWPRVRLSEILLDVRNGIYKPDEFYGSGTRILKMFNIGRMDGTWDLFRVDRVRLEPNEESLYSLRAGDILINRVNSRELVGKCAVVDNLVAGSVFESKNMRLRLKASLAFPTYVAAFLNSSYGREQIEKRTRRIVGQATINRADLDSIEIQLPPQEEQQRIAAGLGSRFAVRTDICRALEDQLVLVNRLPAAFLRRTFNGEL